MERLGVESNVNSEILVKSNDRRQYTFLNHQLNVVWFETDYNNFNNTIEKVSSYIKNN